MVLSALAITGMLAQTFGYREAGRAARAHGDALRARAEFDAWQAEEEGKLAIAISQRAAHEERRQSDLVASRALAVAAASGGSVSDPTIVNLLAKAKGEGAYRASVALYEGRAKARQLKLQAAVRRVEGADAQIDGANRQMGYALQSGASLLRGGLLSRYGGGGPELMGPSNIGDSVAIGRDGWPT